MRFQVWARDFRARKNLVGKSVSNCVLGVSGIIPGREMFRVQGRRVRERASVQVERIHGENIFAGAPLGLSRREAPAGRVCGAFCRVVSGREPEREPDRAPEREQERENKAAAARARSALESSGLKRWARLGPESTPGGLAGESGESCLRNSALLGNDLPELFRTSRPLWRGSELRFPTGIWGRAGKRVIFLAGIFCLGKARFSWETGVLSTWAWISGRKR